jgi:putative RNA 2'-phosphotransferase
VKHVQKLSKFFHYVLGLRPDEFGLVTDLQGFIKIKTFLQALHEEPEWGFIRRSHLNELIMICRPSPIEIQDNLIRAADRTELPRPVAVETDLPKLLYVSVRQRSHPAITEYGINPVGGIPFVVMSSTKEMAARLGHRIDNNPVLITVQVTESLGAGVAFQRYGDHLYLATHLPPGTIISPPLSKTFDKKKSEKGKNQTQKPDEPGQKKMPGSVFPDPSRFFTAPMESDQSNRRKTSDWKKQRRQARKYKRKQQGTD